MTHKKRRKTHIHQPPCKHEWIESPDGLFNSFGGSVVGLNKCELCGVVRHLFDLNKWLSNRGLGV